MTVTVRVRSLVWFATGAVMALVCTLLVTEAWRAEALPGDQDATFVPVTPCRLFDLRAEPFQVGPRSAPLGPNETYEQQVTGGVGDCTGALAIPSSAVAVAMNVTAVSPTEASFVAVFPADLDEVPTVSNLNFTAGQAPTPNKVDVKLSPDGAVKLFNRFGSVSVLGDVVGYYTDTTLKQAVSTVATSSRSSVDVSGWTRVTDQFGVTSTQSGVVVATFEVEEGTDNQRVQCGFGTSSSTEPFSGARWTWESPDQGDITPVTISWHFDGRSSIVLLCRNIEGGTSTIRNTYMTVLANNG